MSVDFTPDPERSVRALSIHVCSPLQVFHRHQAGLHLIELAFRPEDLQPYVGNLQPYSADPKQGGYARLFSYPTVPTTPVDGRDLPGVAPPEDNNFPYRTLILIKVHGGEELVPDTTEELPPPPTAEQLALRREPVQPTTFNLMISYEYSEGPALDHWRMRVARMVRERALVCGCTVPYPIVCAPNPRSRRVPRILAPDPGGIHLRSLDYALALPAVDSTSRESDSDDPP